MPSQPEPQHCHPELDSGSIDHKQYVDNSATTYRPLRERGIVTAPADPSTHPTPARPNQPKDNHRGYSSKTSPTQRTKPRKNQGPYKFHPNGTNEAIRNNCHHRCCSDRWPRLRRHRDRSTSNNNDQISRRLMKRCRESPLTPIWAGRPRRPWSQRIGVRHRACEAHPDRPDCIGRTPRLDMTSARNMRSPRYSMPSRLANSPHTRKASLESLPSHSATTLPMIKKSP